jgi:DNA-binding NarL/FixJ family response regulator
MTAALESPTIGSKAATVVVADRMALAIEGICSVLSTEPELTIVGQATSFDSATALVRAMRPDIVLFDPDLAPQGAAIETVAAWQRQQPGLKAILIMARPERSLVRGAFTESIAGLLLKNSPPSTLRQAVEAVRSGQVFLDADLACVVADLTGDRRRHRGPMNLSPSELRVLEQLPLGRMNAEIAADLGLSVHTVKSHLRNLIVKLGCRDRAQAAAIAIKLGLV